MIASVEDNHWITIHQLSPDVEEQLISWFSVRDPQSYYLNTESGWDGWYRRYQVSKQRLALPYLNELIARCKKANIPLEIEDKRGAPRFPAPQEDQITEKFLDGITLDGYQVRGIRACCVEEIGLVSSPTGSGKCTTGEAKILVNGLEMCVDELFVGFEEEENRDVSDFGLYVLGADGYSRIRKLYKTNKRYIYKILLENGMSIRGVFEHKVYSKSGWINIGDLKNDTEIYTKGGHRFINERDGDLQSREEIYTRSLWEEKTQPLYKIQLCAMWEHSNKNSEEIHPDTSEIWKSLVCNLYTEIKRTKQNNNRETKEGFPQISCDKQSYEEPASRSEGSKDLSGEIWRSGSSNISETKSEKVIRDEKTKGKPTVVPKSDSEISRDIVSKKHRRIRRDKSEKIKDLEEESRYCEQYKRIVFESSQNSDVVSDYEIWKTKLPEPIRVAFHRIMRKIESSDLSKKRTDNSMPKFLVYIRLSGNNGTQEDDSGDKIGIFIQTEEGVDITEKIGCRRICKEELDDISLARLRQGEGDGFFVPEANWVRVKSVLPDGIENCYAIEVVDRTHSYWTNNILSHNTEMICGLVKAFRCPTVIVTEQIVVLEQIVERLALRNVVHNNDIGMFCCGFMPSNNLVLVGSIQSVSSPKRPNRTALAEKFDVANALSVLEGWCSKGNPVVRKLFPTALADALYDNPSGVHRLHGKYLQVVTDHFLSETWKRLWKAFTTRLSNAQKIQELVKRCDLAIIDEADLATNQLYTTFFKKYFSGRRRYGFTGTPYDKNKPVQALFLRENLGNVIFEVPRAEVEAAKRIIPIKFYMIGIGEGGNREDKRAFDIAMKQEIIENKAFHQRVAEIVSAFQNDRSLILVDTSPIAPLGVGLEECIPGSKFIYGGTPRNIRNKYVEDFENGKLTCLIGSKIFRRGLDLRGGVDNLIIIGGGKSWSDFDQKLGRAVRVNKRGWSRVFGFFYFNNRYLYRHSRENLKAVVDLGYETKVIVGGTEIEGDKFIRSKFRIPKGKG